MDQFADFLRAVLGAFSVTAEEFFSKWRPTRIVRARFAVCLYFRRLDYSWGAIGDLAKLDPASVRNGLLKGERLYAADADFRSKYLAASMLIGLLEEEPS